jgi:hypothetical protein
VTRLASKKIKTGDRVVLIGPAYRWSEGLATSYTVLGIDRDHPTGTVFTINVHYHGGRIGMDVGYRLCWPAGPNATGNYATGTRSSIFDQGMYESCPPLVRGR